MAGKGRRQNILLTFILCYTIPGWKGCKVAVPSPYLRRWDSSSITQKFEGNINTTNNEAQNAGLGYVNGV